MDKLLIEMANDDFPEVRTEVAVRLIDMIDCKDIDYDDLIEILEELLKDPFDEVKEKTP